MGRKVSHRELTVLTCSLESANILAPFDTIKLHVIGGEFSPKNKDFVGEGAIKTLERYFVDKAFISCRSVHIRYGITDTNDGRSRLHQTALEHAREKYLVVDHSKLNNVSFSRIAPVTSVDGIIMDQEFPPEWTDYLTAHQIKMF